MFNDELIVSKIKDGYSLSKMFYRLKFIENNRWVICGEDFDSSRLKELKQNISESKMFRVTTWKK